MDVITRIDFKDLNLKPSLNQNEKIEMSAIITLLLISIFFYEASGLFVLLLIGVLRYFVSVLHHSDIINYKGSLVSLFVFEVIEVKKVKKSPKKEASKE